MARPHRLLLLALIVAAPLLGGCPAPPPENDRTAPLTPAAPLRPAGDGWTLRAMGIRPDYRGTYLGNGYLGQRFGLLGWAEGAPDPLPTFVAGLYVDERLTPIPSIAAMRIAVDGVECRPDAIESYQQELRLREGRLVTHYTWRSPRGPVNVAVDAAICLDRPHVFVLHLTIQNQSQSPVEVAARLPAIPPPWTSSGWQLAASDGTATAFLASPEGDERVAIAVALAPLGDASAAERLPAAGSDLLRLRIPPGRTGDLLRVTAVATQRDVSDPLAFVERECRQAIGESLATIWGRHEAAWARVWEGDIEIEGDLAAQQLVRVARFYLRGSIHPDRADGIPPMGLSSDAFGGHVFWDMDTWMLPAVLPHSPELARAMLEYRYRTLPGARALARQEGRRGASFAWESARTGRETVGQMNTRHGRHVTGDVALAAWQYWLATADRAWLRSRGWPLLRETAQYWAARAVRTPDGYTIRQVMTPDENAGLVDDSAWTNHVAALNLRNAAAVARLLGERPRPEWERIARGLRIVTDPQTGLFLPFAGYRGRPAKQADLLLIFFPGERELPPDRLAAHYDYYADRVIASGPAMTESIHGVIAARLGRAEEALRRFRAAYEPFVRPPFYLFSEKRTRDNVCFLTGLGGCLQSVIYGFAGLRWVDSPEPQARPCLPPGWSALRLRGIQWRGARYDLEIVAGAAPRWQRLATPAATGAATRR